MYNPREIFEFVARHQALGRRLVMVTVLHTSGASVRNQGSHMAVAEDGSYAGSLSGGCIEVAVVAEAQDTLAAGQPRLVRFGAGSAYIDLRLPCGGRVDLQFCEILEADIGIRALELFDRRLPFVLTLNGGGNPSIATSQHQRFGIDHSGSLVRIAHIPQLRLALIGHAAAIDTLRELAQASGAQVAVISPSFELIERSAQRGCQTILLDNPRASLDLPLDSWTAAAVLFHDHDWEPPLLKQVLSSQAFFIGAMGSRKTHEARCAALRDAGLDEAEVARIIAPIGIIPSMRDPETLAISVLAQVVDRYNAAFLT